MPSAAFTALVAKATHSPVLVIRHTVPNAVGGGETSFLYCDAFAQQLPLRIKQGSGEDILPIIQKAGGGATSISPGKVSTARGVRSVTFRDLVDWPESLGAGGLVSSGGSYFQRFMVAYPGWHRSKVELLLGFDHPTMDDLADWEPLFTQQLENISFTGDDDVEWQLADIYTLKGEQVPTPVGDEATLVTNVGPYATDFEVSNPDLWLDPATELPSVDWLAPVLVLEPDTVDEERVAIARKASDGKLVCCQNYLSYPEDFTAWTVASGSWTRIKDAVSGPWGPENGNYLETSGAGKLSLGANKAAGSSNSINFAGWLRGHPDDVGRQVTLYIDDGVGNLATQVVTLTQWWKRYDVAYNGAAGSGNYAVGISVAGAAKFYATQAQAVWSAASTIALVRQFYVTSQNLGPFGEYAGRGVYGTTPVLHSNGDPITERAYYRRYGIASDASAEGLHPVWIVADLLNRGHVPPSWGDATLHLENFQVEADYRSGARLRRYLVDPQSVESLIVEFCEQFLLSVWCDRLGYMRCRIDWRPRGPGTTWATLTRDADMVQRGQRATGFRWETNKASQANYVRVAWGLRFDDDGKEKAGDRIEDYEHLAVEGDFSPAIVGTDFRSLAGKTIFAKAIYQAGDAVALAGRYLQRFKRGARKLQAIIGFRRFFDLDVGESYRIVHPSLRTVDGTSAGPGAPLFQATEIGYGDHADDMPSKFLEAWQTKLAHITPTSTDYSGTFPNDYDLATDDERDFYGFIGDTDNKVGAAKDEGYVIG
jgi:hypothetical protein